MATYSTAQFIALVQTLTATVQSLQHQLSWFQRQMFGTNSGAAAGSEECSADVVGRGADTTRTAGRC